MVEVVIISENSCHFVSCCNNIYFFSAWDKSRVEWNNSQKLAQK